MKIIFKDYILELSLDEWKELSSSPERVNTQIEDDSSHKSKSISPDIPIKDNSHKSFNRPNNAKITNDQIRLIKKGFENKIEPKNIAKNLGVSLNQVYYWRYNTPKDLYE